MCFRKEPPDLEYSPKLWGFDKDVLATTQYISVTKPFTVLSFTIKENTTGKDCTLKSKANFILV